MRVMFAVAALLISLSLFAHARTPGPEPEVPASEPGAFLVSTTCYLPHHIAETSAGTMVAFRCDGGAYLLRPLP